MARLKRYSDPNVRSSNDSYWQVPKPPKKKKGKKATALKRKGVTYLKTTASKQKTTALVPVKKANPRRKPPSGKDEIEPYVPRKKVRSRSSTPALDALKARSRSSTPALDALKARVRGHANAGKKKTDDPLAALAARVRGHVGLDAAKGPLKRVGVAYGSVEGRPAKKARKGKRFEDYIGEYITKYRSKCAEKGKNFVRPFCRKKPVRKRR